MKILDQTEAFAELCRATGKWGMRISFDADSDPMETLKAAPYLSLDENAQVLCDGNAIILFDSEKYCLATYGLTVGDDGPTKSNPYDGPARVYALTCAPNGELRNENT